MSNYSYEVFHVPTNYQPEPEEGEDPYADGWYWWWCLPGCLPSSEPYGPFATEGEAYEAVEEEIAELEEQ